MDHFIDHLEIRNFKSIRELKLTGFKRINLFIGRPNVGKSNLLEALSLFSLPFIWTGSKKLTDLLRFINPFEIFHEEEVVNTTTKIFIKRTSKVLDNITIIYN